ncbi:MAG: helix-turn-helix transcriptional regulator, partial [Treponema sp.]|nr:helix-turn-helix transcriptional regulator [Treponema sp.]
LLCAINDILSGQTFVQQNLVSPLITYKTMYDGLTKQEQKIFKKLLERKTKAQIAEELNIVTRSVDNYLFRIFEKTGTKGHEELIEKFGE